MDDIVIRSWTLISWENKKFQSITRIGTESRTNEIESRHTSRNWDGGRYRCAWAFEIGNITVSVYKISSTELAVVIHGCYQTFRDKPNLEYSGASHTILMRITILRSSTLTMISVVPFTDFLRKELLNYFVSAMLLNHDHEKLYWMLLFCSIMRVTKLIYNYVPKLSFTGGHVRSVLHIKGRSYNIAHRVRTLVKLTWELINYT